jgi:putative transposase
LTATTPRISLPNQMRRRRPLQLELPPPRTRGGARRGAGRPPSCERPGPPHVARSEHHRRHPAHVTLRADPGLPSLRSGRVFPALRAALAAASRDDFRLIQFSVQRDHLHLIVETEDAGALSRGMQALAVRCARAINRCAKRRGRVWAHRYHVRTLKSPTEVRRALVYVLMNIKKHDPIACDGIDPCSSALWFDGFVLDRTPPDSPPPLPAPRTWLAAHGWRRCGLIDPRERPRPEGARPLTARTAR